MKIKELKVFITISSVAIFGLFFLFNITKVNAALNSATAGDDGQPGGCYSQGQIKAGQDWSGRPGSQPSGLNGGAGGQGAPAGCGQPGGKGGNGGRGGDTSGSNTTNPTAGSGGAGGAGGAAGSNSGETGGAGGNGGNGGSVTMTGSFSTTTKGNNTGGAGGIGGTGVPAGAGGRGGDVILTGSWTRSSGSGGKLTGGNGGVGGTNLTGIASINDGCGGNGGNAMITGNLDTASPSYSLGGGNGGFNGTNGGGCGGNGGYAFVNGILTENDSAYTAYNQLKGGAGGDGNSAVGNNGGNGGDAVVEGGSNIVTGGQFKCNLLAGSGGSGRIGGNGGSVYLKGNLTIGTTGTNGGYCAGNGGSGTSKYGNGGHAILNGALTYNSPSSLQKGFAAGNSGSGGPTSANGGNACAMSVGGSGLAGNALKPGTGNPPGNTQNTGIASCPYAFPSVLTATPSTPADSCPAFVNLSWTDAGTNNYNLYRCSGSGCDPTASSAIKIGLTGLSYQDNISLTQGVLYRYAIKAFNSGTLSSPSNIAEATPYCSGNVAPIAVASVSMDGSYYSNFISVVQGSPVNLHFAASSTAGGSYDPNGWTNVPNGVSTSGTCEWNTDLSQGGFIPSAGGTIGSPSSATVCNLSPAFPKTFNDNLQGQPSRTIPYNVLRITDNQGALSVGQISITILAPLAVSCSASPSTINVKTAPVNNSTNWISSPTGGVGSYGYSWSGDVSGTTQTISNQTYSTLGTRNAAVQVTSGSDTKSASCSLNVVPYCGDNIAQSSEQCDGTDLKGATCASLGFSGAGAPTCNAGSCTFNTSGCAVADFGGVKIKVVGQTDTISTAPPSANVKLDSTMGSGNPADFANIVTGSHNAIAKVVNGKSVNAWQCTYDNTNPECTISTLAPPTAINCASEWCDGYPISVQKNKITKVVFKYFDSRTGGTKEK